MSDISGGNFIKGNGIKRTDFEASLKRQNISEQNLKKAMSIFDNYASKLTYGDSSVLEEEEQILARNEFMQMDIITIDGNVSKKEFAQNDKGIEDYEAYKNFTETLNTITENADDKKVISTTKNNTIVMLSDDNNGTSSIYKPNGQKFLGYEFDISNISNNSNSTTISFSKSARFKGYPVQKFLEENMKNLSKENTFESITLYNNDKNPVLTCKNGKFYDETGKEITWNDATIIYSKFTKNSTPEDNITLMLNYKEQNPIYYAQTNQE